MLTLIVRYIDVDDVFVHVQKWILMISLIELTYTIKKFSPYRMIHFYDVLQWVRWGTSCTFIVHDRAKVAV